MERLYPSRVKAITLTAHGLPASRKRRGASISGCPTFAPAFNYDAALHFRLPQWSGDGSSPITHLNSITLAANRQPENKKRFVLRQTVLLLNSL
ncbi:hypothetical protein [Kingella oralis]|uniref:hypothetical protein n=1 Tax=Kingella oralis TaxID=505 RepID=UPI0028EE70C4|nr:hypothetical protein [Kingella oralis]